MATHGHIVRFTAQPGKRDALIAALRPMFAVVESEPGTLLYMMHTSVAEPDVVWFYERYVDEAAFERHRSTPEHDSVLAAIGHLLAVAPEIHYLELVAWKASASLPDGTAGPP
jgi:quinol monooxygenase YgiN